MFNPDSVPYFDVYLRSFKALPQQTSVEVEAVRVRSAADVELAVAKLSREPGSALIAASDAFILAVRGVILKAADQYRVPVISPTAEIASASSLRANHTTSFFFVSGFGSGEYSANYWPGSGSDSRKSFRVIWCYGAVRAGRT